MNANDINGNAEKAKKFAKEALRNGDVVLALDLDYTLAHYKDGLKGLFEITQKLGVPESVARRALAATEASGFSLGLFYQILSLSVHLFVSEGRFMELATPWFRENYALYDDAYEFLAQYLEHVPVVVVTAGDEDFQREKIRVLGFFPNEVIVVPMGTSKIGALKDIYGRYQKLIVFVDDNPDEFGCISLDAWFGFPATSYLVRMSRDDSPHAHVVKHLALHKVRAVNSFEQLQELSLLERSCCE